MLARSSLLLLLAACTSDSDGGSDKKNQDQDDTGTTDTTDTTDTSTTETTPPFSPIGNGDPVAWTYILGPEERLNDPRDLGFDSDGNLWIANRDDDRTFIVMSPGTEDQDHDRRKDGYAEHFMEETSALAFDDNLQFGSCGESDNTYNDQAQGNGYMGPVLWSADLNIFGVENPIGLGSHLDMSHESPFCVGMAWEDANIYWAFDGEHNAITMHDFQADHGVGMDTHDDHIVRRYVEPEITRVEEAPGHMIFHQDLRRLYVSDTGNDRLLWLDVDSGAEGDSVRANDRGATVYKWEGADWGEIATGLSQPGALAFDGTHLYVGEWGTGIIRQFALDGTEVRSLDTEFGAEMLYGIEIGPDGHLWVVNVAEGVFRIDP